MLGRGAAKGNGAAKAVGGLRCKAPVLELVALAPRLPAVAKPERVAKGKAAPKGEAVILAGKAKVSCESKSSG